MSGWAIFWILVLALIVVLIAVNIHDLKRYLKIRNM
ncbi:MAG: hypothetical protein JWP80_1063 [Pseudomonas sp.]|nr:hypothetical protein [Pseudomonas sp.]